MPPKKAHFGNRGKGGGKGSKGDRGYGTSRDGWRDNYRDCDSRPYWKDDYDGYYDDWGDRGGPYRSSWDRGGRDSWSYGPYMDVQAESEIKRLTGRLVAGWVYFESWWVIINLSGLSLALFAVGNEETNAPGDPHLPCRHAPFCNLGGGPSSQIRDPMRPPLCLASAPGPPEPAGPRRRGH